MNPMKFGLPVAAALTAALLSGAAAAQVSDDVVKIGVLTDMNGPASAPTGQGSVTAAQMAVDDFGGKVLGKPISIVIGDHQLKADIGAAIARRWYDVDQVDLIVDVPVSAVGLAVQNIANEKKRLFITHSTGTADFHGKFCSPYAMQWVFDTRALAVGTAQEVVKRGGDSWFFITDDYAFGHSPGRDPAGLITGNGGANLIDGLGGNDGFGASSTGVAMGCASTMGCRESGAVCKTVPLWPSLIPLCVSRITGLRVLLEAANTFDPAQAVANETTMSAAADLNQWIEDMGGPV